MRGLKAFPEALAIRLKHLILSHHGQYDFGSPKEPKFLEAFALNLIDDLDAKINGLGRFMERDRHEGTWTEFNRMFGKYFLKGKMQPTHETPEESIKNREQTKDSVFFRCRHLTRTIRSQKSLTQSRKARKEKQRNFLVIIILNAIII